MDDIIEMIKVAYSEQKMTDEYKFQLNEICEAEDEFIKEFDKGKWKEYFDLELVKGELWLIELDSVIRFVFEFIKNLYK
jgi:nuclear transport factor 2 (NTF2) superfamily protein